MEHRPLAEAEVPESSGSGIEWYHVAGMAVGAVLGIGALGWMGKQLREAAKEEDARPQGKGAPTPAGSSRPQSSSTPFSPDPTPSRFPARPSGPAQQKQVQSKSSAASVPSTPSPSAPLSPSSAFPATPASEFFSMSPSSPSNTSASATSISMPSPVPSQHKVAETPVQRKLVLSPSSPTPPNSPTPNKGPGGRFQDLIRITDEDEEDEEEDDGEMDLDAMLEDTLREHMGGQEHGQEEGPNEPMDLTTSLLLWGQEPLNSGHLPVDILMPDGEDRLLLLIAPMPVAVAYIAFLPNLEERFEGGSIHVIDKAPSKEEVMRLDPAKATLTFILTEVQNACITPLKTLVTGQFIVLRLKGVNKAIDPTQGTVGELGIFGFPGDMAPKSFDPTTFDPFQLKSVMSDFKEYDQTFLLAFGIYRSIVLLEGSDASAFSKAKEVLAALSAEGALKPEFPIHFWVDQSKPKHHLMMKEMLTATEQTSLFIVQSNRSWPFPLTADTTKEEIQAFLADFKSREAVKFPPIFRHPLHSDLFMVVPKEFESTVVKSSFEYLVAVYPSSPQADVFITPMLSDLSFVLHEADKNLRVALMDSVTSIPPELYFPKRFELTLVFFSGGKATPFQGDVTLEALIDFVAANATAKFNGEAAKATGAERARKNVKMLQSEAEFDEILAKAAEEDKLTLAVFSTKKKAAETNYLPFLAHLSEEPSVVIVEIDTSQHKSLAIRQSIQKAPTFKLFKDKEQVDSVLQFDPDEIIGMLQNWAQPQ